MNIWDTFRLNFDLLVQKKWLKGTWEDQIVINESLPTRPDLQFPKLKLYVFAQNFIYGAAVNNLANLSQIDISNLENFVDDLNQGYETDLYIYGYLDTPLKFYVGGQFQVTTTASLIFFGYLVRLWLGELRNSATNYTNRPLFEVVKSA